MATNGHDLSERVLDALAFLGGGRPRRARPATVRGARVVGMAHPLRRTVSSICNEQEQVEKVDRHHRQPKQLPPRRGPAEPHTQRDREEHEHRETEQDLRRVARLTCPDCQSERVAVTLRVESGPYWRCEKCGYIWATGTPGTWPERWCCAIRPSPRPPDRFSGPDVARSTQSWIDRHSDAALNDSNVAQ
jgi:ribosomal protein L37AE/L43A